MAAVHGESVGTVPPLDEVEDAEELADRLADEVVDERTAVRRCQHIAQLRHSITRIGIILSFELEG